MINILRNIRHIQVKKVAYDIFEAHEIDSRAEGILDDIQDLRRYLLLVEEHVTKIKEEL